MKRVTIISIVSVAISLASFFLIVWLTKSDLEKYIIIHNECYIEKWDFDNINIDNENQAISIRFDKKSGAWNNNIDNIQEIYEWLYNKVYESDSLRGYSVNLDFVGIGEYFSIRNISSDLGQLEIRCNTDIELKKISTEFSDAIKIYLFPAFYNDITEIEGFTNPKYIYFSNTMTSEEIVIIKSYFPYCRFECGSYQHLIRDIGYGKIIQSVLSASKGNCAGQEIVLLPGAKLYPRRFRGVGGHILQLYRTNTHSDSGGSLQTIPIYKEDAVGIHKPNDEQANELFIGYSFQTWQKMTREVFLSGLIF